MPAPPRSDVPSVTRLSLLLGTLVALTIVGSSAVAVALPVVGEELSLDKAGTAWILAAFSLTFALATAIFGRLADRRGLRTPLWIGVSLLAAGSLASAAAWSFPSIIVGRLVQGAGAGAVPVLTLGIIAARFSPATRGKALGGLTAVVSIVSGSGPLIGGLVTELLDWRAVIGLPVVALALAPAVARLAPDSPAGGGRLDLRGALLVGVAASALTILLQAPATKPPALILGVLAAALAAAVAALQRHVRQRPDGFLPRRVVSNRRLVLSALTALTLLASYLGVLFGVPLLLAQELGWSPLHIGVALLPAAAAGAVASPLVGARAARLGRYRMAAALAAGSAVGLLLIAGAAPSPVLVIVGVALIVIGFAGGQVALIDGIPGLVDETVHGVALGLFNLVFFTGGAIGSAVTGGLAQVLSLPFALGVLAILPAAGAMAALAARR